MNRSTPSSDRPFTALRHGSVRQGMALIPILAILFLLAAAAGGGWHWMQIKKGKLLEETLQARLNEGNAALERGKMDEAFKAFQTARGIFEEKVFQTYRSWSGANASPGADLAEKNEIDQLLVTVCLFKMYDEAFRLKSAADWAGKAEQHAKNLVGPSVEDTRKRVVTAKGVTRLVDLFRQKKYEPVLKDLLDLEKSSQPGDKDFFIMEVRLLIACGKALKQPDITAQARKLLFALQFEAGLEDSRLDQLWSLLGQ